MKVFVGFGYNKKDEWINDLVIPFIISLGCEVITGEDMQAEALDEGVIARIKEADVCIGFLTRRTKIDKENYTTHRWVVEEIGIAISNKKPTFEIRQKGVDPQNGIAGKFQRFEFDDKAILLLEISKFILKEKEKLTYITFMLLPQDFINEMKSHISSGDATCTYRFLYKAKYYEALETTVESFEGGYGVIIKEIPNEEALLEITIKGPGGIKWKADFFPINIHKVKLIKQH